MTKQDFISYGSRQICFKNFLLQPSEELETYLQTQLKIKRTDFIINFLYSGGFNGYVSFSRCEKNSGDILKIRIDSISSFTFWRDDIQQYVSEIAVISNCAGLIEEFFISEDGRFWNKTNELRAECEDDFFDYLASVEYDFHPIINTRTYDILRHGGWYKGRHVDITEFNIKMKNRGLALSEQQLAFFVEFSGLDVCFTPSDYDWRFFSLDEILDLGEPTYVDKIYDGSIWLGEAVIEIGVWEEGPLYLSSDGRIFDIHFMPLGRTPLESINNLAGHIPPDYKYYF